MLTASKLQLESVPARTSASNALVSMVRRRGAIIPTNAEDFFRMATKRTKIAGKPVRPYSLYRIGLNDEIIELVLRADTLEELEAHSRRPDWKYAIYQNRKKIDPR
jgi:hypothetical protein